MMFAKFVRKQSEGFNYLHENKLKELMATLEAIRDEKKAFKYLIDNKHFELAAFVNSIWDDEKAFKFLIDVKAFDWAACSNIINGDDSAIEALKRAGKEHYIDLAYAIQNVIREDGDRNVSPIGIIKNMFNFKKMFGKDEDN